MRNVKRSGKPSSLSRNGNRWKNELLAAIQNGNDKKRINELTNRYRKKDIKEALRKMYNDLCCYCEAEITHIAFDQIEHRKPKSKTRFRKLTFDWNNLHLVCPICNGHKSDKWSDENEILDATVDDIEASLTYKLATNGVKRWAIDKRGCTTICHAHLNREKLRTARYKIFVKVYNMVLTINKELANNPDAVNPKQILAELRQDYKEEYGSLTKWIVNRNLQNN